MFLGKVVKLKVKLFDILILLIFTFFLYLCFGFKYFILVFLIKYNMRLIKQFVLPLFS
jgi:hypothetical protein